jgi:hypothetical protein
MIEFPAWETTMLFNTVLTPEHNTGQPGQSPWGQPEADQGRVNCSIYHPIILSAKCRNQECYPKQLEIAR